MTVWLFVTVLVRVSLTVAPETATAVTALSVVPSIVTAKSEVVAVVVPVLGASSQSLASS